MYRQGVSDGRGLSKTPGTRKWKVESQRYIKNDHRGVETSGESVNITNAPTRLCGTHGDTVQSLIMHSVIMHKFDDAWVFTSPTSGPL